MAESFPTPAAWRKAQAEIDEYHRLQKFVDDLIVVNTEICQHRPATPDAGGWTPQEKKRLLRSIRRSPAK